MESLLNSKIVTLFFKIVPKKGMKFRKLAGPPEWGIIMRVPLESHVIWHSFISNH